MRAPVATVSKSTPTFSTGFRYGPPLQKSERLQARMEATPRATPQHIESPLVANRGDRQRKSVKLFAVGTPVEVYDPQLERWLPDGVVENVQKDAGEVEGVSVRAGSMRIVYDNGARFQWVAPQHCEVSLRAAPVPQVAGGHSATIAGSPQGGKGNKGTCKGKGKGKGKQAESGAGGVR